MSISNPAPAATVHLSVGNQEINQLIREGKFLISGGHFNIGRGYHSETWVCKDSMIADPTVVESLCQPLSTRLGLLCENVDAVVGRANGGLVIASQLALQWSKQSKQPTKCYFAEETDHDGLKFRPSFSKALEGKRVVVTSVVITTGTTIREVANEVRLQGGEVVGAVAWFRRTLTSPSDFGHVPFLLTLDRANLQSWAEGPCPLCDHGTALSNEYGIHLPDKF
ncbi:MAG: hypothetical protein AAB669_02265 [Patescibacteria group bacterium]